MSYSYKWIDGIGIERKFKTDIALPNAKYSNCGITFSVPSKDHVLLYSYATLVMEYHISTKTMYYSDYCFFSVSTNRHSRKFVDYINAEHGTHFRGPGAFKKALKECSWLAVKADKPEKVIDAF